MARASEDPERGLAHERTILAWNRTGLAAVVCIAVLLRNLAPIHSTGQEIALGLIAAAGILWAVVLLAFTLSGTNRFLGALWGARVFFMMTGATVMLALVGFLIGLVAAP